MPLNLYELKKLGMKYLPDSDGKGCRQVTVENEEELTHWREQANIHGYLMAFDHHTPMEYSGDTYDVYQIFPPEQKEKFAKMKILDF